MIVSRRAVALGKKWQTVRPAGGEEQAAYDGGGWVSVHDGTRLSRKIVKMRVLEFTGMDAWEWSPLKTCTPTLLSWGVLRTDDVSDAYFDCFGAGYDECS